MNRAAFRRFEFFDVETIADDIAGKLVRRLYSIYFADIPPKIHFNFLYSKDVFQHVQLQKVVC